MTDIIRLEERLNSETESGRLSALKDLMARYDTGELERPLPGENVNNHIHTTYSFSPYSPTAAAYLAWKNGLATAGIMDHDSVSGLREFIEAGRIIGSKVTVGFELRVSFAGTPFEGRRINNPDQDSVVYLAMHGIPHDKIDEADAFLRPLREARNLRNRQMTAKLNDFVRPTGLEIDFEKDVLPLSQYKNGGAVTERHILYSLAQKIMDKISPGPGLISFLEDNYGIKVTESNREKLNDPGNQWYRYYLLGVLKGHMMQHFYINADAELPSYSGFVNFGKSIGAVPAYAYLGDVGDSITGDKRTQQFEDAYLDELVVFLKEVGFKAITYMPSRNTDSQLKRLMALCEKHDLFEICGEDINSPFQPFICKALEREEYKHLITAAWALIGHEKAPHGAGIFSDEAIHKYPSLKERIQYFANMGMIK